jgi:glycosyltransferase involved in cell wall biosynthesis
MPSRYCTAVALVFLLTAGFVAGAAENADAYDVVLGDDGAVVYHLNTWRKHRRSANAPIHAGVLLSSSSDDQRLVGQSLLSLASHVIPADSIGIIVLVTCGYVLCEDAMEATAQSVQGWGWSQLIILPSEQATTHCSGNSLNRAMDSLLHVAAGPSDRRDLLVLLMEAATAPLRSGVGKSDDIFTAYASLRVAMRGSLNSLVVQNRCEAHLLPLLLFDLASLERAGRFMNTALNSALDDWILRAAAVASINVIWQPIGWCSDMLGSHETVVYHVEESAAITCYPKSFSADFYLPDRVSPPGDFDFLSPDWPPMGHIHYSWKDSLPSNVDFEIRNAWLTETGQDPSICMQVGESQGCVRDYHPKTGTQSVRLRAYLPSNQSFEMQSPPSTWDFVGAVELRSWSWITDAPPLDDPSVHYGGTLRRPARLAFVSNTLYPHSFCTIWLKLSQELASTEFHVEWFVPFDVSTDTWLARKLKERNIRINLVPLVNAAPSVQAELQAPYISRLRGFDIVLFANSRNEVQSTRLQSMVQEAGGPIRVCDLPNIYPSEDLPAEVFVAPSQYAGGHPSVTRLGVPVKVIYPAGIKWPDQIQRSEESCTRQRLTVGFLGRLDSDVHPGLFVHAALSLTMLLPTVDLHFLVAGEGTVKYSTQALAEAFGIADLFTFVGHVDREGIPELLSRIGVLLISIPCQTFGMSAAEAALSNVPTVGFSACGNAESIVLGTKISSFSPMALAIAVADIWDHSCNLPPVNPRAAEAFSLKAMVSGYRDLFFSLLESRSQERAAEVEKWAEADPSLVAPHRTLHVAFSPGSFWAEVVVTVLLKKSLSLWELNILRLSESSLLVRPDILIVSSLDTTCSSDGVCVLNCQAIINRHTGDHTVVIMANGEPTSVGHITGVNISLQTTTRGDFAPSGADIVYMPLAISSFFNRWRHTAQDLMRTDHSVGHSREGVGYLNFNCGVPTRELFHDLLEDRGLAVFSLGRCQGVRRGPAPNFEPHHKDRFAHDWHDRAIEKLESVKFAIAFESYETLSGYVTEKIVNAYIAGTVPIYLGSTDVDAIFNPASFINCSRFQSLETCADEVARLYYDDDAIAAFLSQPATHQSQFDQFFSWLPSVQGGDVCASSPTLPAEFASLIEKHFQFSL